MPLLASWERVPYSTIHVAVALQERTVADADIAVVACIVAAVGMEEQGIPLGNAAAEDCTVLVRHGGSSCNGSGVNEQASVSLAVVDYNHCDAVHEMVVKSHRCDVPGSHLVHGLGHCP